MSNKEVILKTALFSRSLLIVVQYFSNLLIPDHDADAYRYPKTQEIGILDKIVTHLFGGFVRWDAQYFMHISIYGYSYEHILAFFPFYPILAKFFVFILGPFFSCFNVDSLTLLVFLGINIYCFVKAALCLYKLTCFVANKDLALKATILFCYNPASVFFTAPYTESLFCYLTFRSMLNCVLLYKKYCNKYDFRFRELIPYIIPICLSTLTRSNGVLNIGFLVFVLICVLRNRIDEKVLLGDAPKFVIVISSLVIICLLPFICFQVHSHTFFCKDRNMKLPYLPPAVLEHKDIGNFVLPGTFSKHNQSWCYQKIPLAYSYVQSHYWKVGFLKYYEMKQMPNFILAAPIIFIILGHSIQFFRRFPKTLSDLFNMNSLLEKEKGENNYFPLMVVFIIHATVLTVFCALNIHIQVTTRMLCSASPVLYWFSSYYLTDTDLFKKLFEMQWKSKEWFIVAYFLGYYFVGTIMFCNFLPWT